MIFRTLWRDPLVHFLIVGVLIFVGDAWWNRTSSPVADDKRIEVNAGRIAQLREGFERAHQRPPDEVELRGLITAHLHEEVLYREALALGLERDDSIIRRRLAQKMEFLASDLARAAPPSAATLEAYFRQESERYREANRFSFRHVYVSQHKHGDGSQTKAQAILDDLIRGVAEDSLGDGFFHGFVFHEQNDDDIRALFGGTFLTQLVDLEDACWAGPIASTYGLHLVFIEARQAGRLPDLDTIRERVLRDYHESQRLRANQILVQDLQARYTIVIDEHALHHPECPEDDEHEHDHAPAPESAP